MPYTLEMQIFRFPETTRKAVLKFWFTGKLAFQKFFHHIQKTDSHSLWRYQMDSLRVKCKETILCVIFSAVGTIWRGRISACSHHLFHPLSRYKGPLWPVLFKSTNCRQYPASGFWDVLSLLLHWKAWWERKVISCAPWSGKMLQLMCAAHLMWVPCEDCFLEYMLQETVQSIDWVLLGAVPLLGIGLRLNKVQKLSVFQWPQGQFSWQSECSIFKI